MRKLRGVWVALGVMAAGPASAATYVNARFGYTVSYPANLLVAQPEATNGDGRRFTSRTGRATFTVFAAHDVEPVSPRDLARSAETVCQGTAPTLRVARPRLVAMSCVHNGLIYYAKVLLRNGTQIRLIAAYPIGERAVWDRVVTVMAGSLSP